MIFKATSATIKNRLIFEPALLPDMSKFSIEIKWSVVFTAASIAWAILEKSTGFHGSRIGIQPAFTFLFGIFALLVFILALREKKREYYHSRITWTQTFLSGVYLAFFCAAFSPFAQYITYTYISPGFFDTMINYMVANGERTREKAAAVFNLESYIVQSVSFTLSMGILTSAIIALFLRTKDISRS